jgi:hypothetical protein
VNGEFTALAQSDRRGTLRLRGVLPLRVPLLLFGNGEVKLVRHVAVNDYRL